MELRTASAWLCAFGLAAGATHAHGQGLKLGASAPSGTAGQEEPLHPRGTYAGVKPGGNEHPAAPAKAGTKPAGITWPGFQMQPDGSSRVFLQTTVPLDVHSSLLDGKVVVELGDARIVGDTNRFPLFTQFFNTPVTRVEIIRTGKRTALVIALRAQVEPKLSHAVAASGFHFVYIDFPPGNYVSTAEQVPVVAPPAAPQDDSQRVNARYRAPVEDAPTHLDGDVSAGPRTVGASKSQSGSSATLENELPPGMAKPKAKTKASGKAKLSL